MDDEKYVGSTAAMAVDIALSALFMLSAVFGNTSTAVETVRRFVTESMLAAGGTALILTYLYLTKRQRGKFKYIMLLINIMQVLWVIIVYAAIAVIG